MLNALKDLYICYPFMESWNSPEWTKHVKDIHIVVELMAGDLEDDMNGDRLTAFITGTTGSTATVTCTCGSIVEVKNIGIYRESAGCPATQNYMLVDDEFDLAVDHKDQRIHPDCIVWLQEAPVIVGQTSSVVCFQNGNNINATDTTDGVLLYGVENGGTGRYKQVLSDVAPYRLGKGLVAVNGMTGDIWVRGSYPVKTTEKFTAGKLVLTVTTDEVTE